MKAIKQMLMGIAIMIASIAFSSVWDNDFITCVVAIIGLIVVICGYLNKDGKGNNV